MLLLPTGHGCPLSPHTPQSPRRPGLRSRLLRGICSASCPPTPAPLPCGNGPGGGRCGAMAALPQHPWLSGSPTCRGAGLRGKLASPTAAWWPQWDGDSFLLASVGCKRDWGCRFAFPARPSREDASPWWQRMQPQDGSSCSSCSWAVQPPA